MTAENDTSQQQTVEAIQSPPKSFKERFKWLGPGITWMAAGAGGAGELLLPPRIGSLYGLAFLWAVVVVIILKWFMSREVGRYAVATGASLLQGFKQLPGPKNWAVWLIIVPQLVVAMASISGLASSAATAVILMLPGSVTLWTAVIVGLTTTFLIVGAYKGLELASTIFAILLALIAIIAAVTVFPPIEEILQGLKPSLPQETDYQEVLPWLSFVLAGAAGLIWYSYWVPAAGYGAGMMNKQRDEPIDPRKLKDEQVDDLRGWIKEMNIDITLGVFGGFLIVAAFLLLGAELLQPKGLVPEEKEVADVLGNLFGDIWGNWGYWMMVAGVLIGFVATVMTNQDGWARLMADGTDILIEPMGVTGRWRDPDFLRVVFLIVLLTVGPVGLYLLMGEPVALIQLAGIIEAIHIPFIIFLTIYLNTHHLPEKLQPSWVSIIGSILAGLFFIVFAGFFLAQQFGWLGG